MARVITPLTDKKIQKAKAKEKNKIREAYNRTSNRDLIEPMREVIEWYADYFEGVKNGNN